MWQLTEQVRELQQHGPMQMNGRLLLVRCRLLKDADADRKHQELVIELMLRLLRRQFGARELAFQVSESDILVVLLNRPVHEAVPVIVDLVAELRRRLLGGAAPRETITIDSISLSASGEVTSTEILSEDGRVNRAALDEEAPEEKPQAAATPLEPLDPKTVLRPGDLRYDFTPVWDVRRKAVTTWYLRCHGYKAGFAGEETGYGVLHGGSKSSLVPDLDLKLLERAGAELGRYRDGRMPFVLVWPLHARTVDSPAAFQRYAEILAELAEFVRGRMVVAVHGLKPDWPVSRMQWVVGAARRYCRAVTVHMPLDADMLPAMASCGVTNVSFDLSRQVDDATLAARLRKLRDPACKLGLACVAHRVPTRGIAIAAVSAGFSFVHGDFIGAMPKPGSAFRYDVIDLVNAAPDLGPAAVAGIRQGTAAGA